MLAPSSRRAGSRGNCSKNTICSPLWITWSKASGQACRSLRLRPVVWLERRRRKTFAPPLISKLNSLVGIILHAKVQKRFCLLMRRGFHSREARAPKWEGVRGFPWTHPSFPGIRGLRVAGLNHGGSGNQPDRNLAWNELFLLAARAELKFGTTERCRCFWSRRYLLLPPSASVSLLSPKPTCLKECFYHLLFPYICQFVPEVCSARIVLPVDEH